LKSFADGELLSHSQAAMNLGLTGSSQDAYSLMSVIASHASESWALRWAATGSLATLASESISVDQFLLERLTKDPDWPIRTEAAHAFLKRGPPEDKALSKQIAASLRERIEDKDEALEVKHAALKALVPFYPHLPSDRDSFLIDQMKSTEPTIRWFAVEAAGLVAKKSLGEAIRERLLDASDRHYVREQAAWAMAGQSPRMIREARELLQRSYNEVMVSVFTGHGLKATEKMLKLLSP